MKKIYICLSLIFLCSAVFALEDDTPFTEGKINGVAWNNLDFEPRLYFVAGLKDGIGLSEKFYSDFVEFDKEEIKKILARSIEVYTIKATNMEIISYFNEFYSDPENLNIPVSEVYWVMFYDYNGFGEKAVDKIVDNLRSKYLVRCQDERLAPEEKN